jgi:hypothetical protein
MFVPDRKHTYGPLRPLTGSALLFVLTLRYSRHCCTRNAETGLECVEYGLNSTVSGQDTLSGSYKHDNVVIILGCSQGRYCLTCRMALPIFGHAISSQLSRSTYLLRVLQPLLLTCNVKVGLGCETTAVGPPSMGETTAVGTRTLAASSVSYAPYEVSHSCNMKLRPMFTCMKQILVIAKLVVTSELLGFWT